MNLCNGKIFFMSSTRNSLFVGEYNKHTVCSSVFGVVPWGPFLTVSLINNLSRTEWVDSDGSQSRQRVKSGHEYRGARNQE
jgi:hypothetical protein